MEYNCISDLPWLFLNIICCNSSVTMFLLGRPCIITYKECNLHIIATHPKMISTTCALLFFFTSSSLVLLIIWRRGCRCAIGSLIAKAGKFKAAIAGSEFICACRECPLDRFTKELFFNFGGSRLFLMEDFIALPVPKIFFVQMLPLPLVLALVFFTRVGSSWRRQKTTCGSIVCHFMNVSHLFCTNTPYTTPKNGQQQRQ